MENQNKMLGLLRVVGNRIPDAFDNVGKIIGVILAIGWLLLLLLGAFWIGIVVTKVFVQWAGATEIIGFRAFCCIVVYFTSVIFCAGGFIINRSLR